MFTRLNLCLLILFFIWSQTAYTQEKVSSHDPYADPRVQESYRQWIETKNAERTVGLETNRQQKLLHENSTVRLQAFSDFIQNRTAIRTSVSNKKRTEDTENFKKFMQLIIKSETINNLKLKKLAFNTPKKKLVSLVFEELNCFPIGNEIVQYENKIIGITTSAAFGFRINKPVALAMINFHHYKNFKQVEVNIGQNIFFAKVIEGAVYDPNGDKMINY